MWVDVCSPLLLRPRPPRRRPDFSSPVAAESAVARAAGSLECSPAPCPPDRERLRRVCLRDVDLPPGSVTAGVAGGVGSAFGAGRVSPICGLRTSAFSAASGVVGRPSRIESGSSGLSSSGGCGATPGARSVSPSISSADSVPDPGDLRRRCPPREPLRRLRDAVPGSPPSAASEASAASLTSPTSLTDGGVGSWLVSLGTAGCASLVRSAFVWAEDVPVPVSAFSMGFPSQADAELGIRCHGNTQRRPDKLGRRAGLHRGQAIDGCPVTSGLGFDRAGRPPGRRARGTPHHDRTSLPAAPPHREDAPRAPIHKISTGQSQRSRSTLACGNLTACGACGRSGRGRTGRTTR